MVDFKRPPFSLTARLVAKAAELRGVDPHRIFRRERTHKIAYARFGVIWALRSRGYSYVEIANAIGMADHTSVIYAMKRAEELAREDHDYLMFIVRMLGFAEEANG